MCLAGTCVCGRWPCSKLEPCSGPVSVLQRQCQAASLKVASLLLADICQLRCSSMSAFNTGEAYVVRFSLGAAVALSLFLLAKKLSLAQPVGFLVTCLRVPAALGFGMSLEPLALSRWFWVLFQHRCFVASCVAVAVKVPAVWFWIGSIVSATCALIYDHVALPPSLPLEQLATAAGASAVGAPAAAFAWQLPAAAHLLLDPFTLVQLLRSIPASCVVLSAAEVLLPGLLLHVLHAQAGMGRRRQQQLGTPDLDAAARSAAASPQASARAARDDSCSPSTINCKEATAAGTVAGSVGHTANVRRTDQAEEEMVHALHTSAGSRLGGLPAAAAPCAGQCYSNQQTLSDSASSVKAMITKLGSGELKAMEQCLVEEQAFAGHQVPAHSNEPLERIASSIAVGNELGSHSREGMAATQRPLADAAAPAGRGSRQGIVVRGGSSSSLQDSAAAAAAFRYRSPLSHKIITVGLQGPADPGTVLQEPLELKYVTW